MKNRKPLAVFFLSIITIGIYGIVWSVKTKNEMNRLGAKIPTAWLLVIPIVSLYWLWKYSEGVDFVTRSKLSTPLAFVILWLLSIIGMAIVQSEFNKVTSEPPVPATPSDAFASTPQPPTTPNYPATATPQPGVPQGNPSEDNNPAQTQPNPPQDDQGNNPAPPQPPVPPAQPPVVQG